MTKSEAVNKIKNVDLNKKIGELWLYKNYFIREMSNNTTKTVPHATKVL